MKIPRNVETAIIYVAEERTNAVLTAFSEREYRFFGWKPAKPPKWDNVCLAKVIGRYYLDRTVLPLVGLFNDRVLELGTGTHPKVGALTLADNVVLRELRLVSYLNLEA